MDAIDFDTLDATIEAERTSPTPCGGRAGVTR
jgi:hypothetical protein